MYHIFIISDGTGRTAKQALSAALTQFPEQDVKVQLHQEVRSKEQVKKIITEAKKNKGFIVHTIVSKEMRNFILETARLHNLETIDLMGPLLGQLSHQFAKVPAERPGLFHELNKAYFQRIEAVEFALRHDDGQRVDELTKAEIVLVGVSRTFKTPLSIYLAFKGWLVANVPIVLDLEPASILFSLPHGRVFALSTQVGPLASLRKVRDEHLGGAAGDYAKPQYVHRELLYAKKIFNEQSHWPIIEVTNKPIEEIADEILSIIRKWRDIK